ncbi:sugar phosphate isomerase/epimerase family protein [Lysinibacillus telephonicus]|uniref:sugar phosphate isomerase/epimerase family protein n=1 Tax=Lysinibacillus telephonicus TaxID=1714840 RepID=UPI003BA0C7E3
MDSSIVRKEGAAMNLFASSTLFWGHSFEHICKVVKAENLKGIEIWVEQLQFQDWNLHEIQHLLHAYHLQATIHANSWDLNLCSLNAGIRNQSIREVENSIRIANKLCIPSITVHPGKLTVYGRWEQNHRNIMLHTLDELTSLADKYSVNISLELMEPASKEIYCEARKINDLVAFTDDCIQTTFDIAHIPFHFSIADELKALQKVDKIHVSDSTNTTYHVPLGKGELQLDCSLWETIDSLKVPVVLEGLDTSKNHVFFYDHLEYFQTNSLLQLKGVT